MEDIIIDDRRQLSAKAVNREISEQKTRKPRRTYGGYWADLFISGLIAALFALIDLSLFAQAGSYSLFTPEQRLSAEALLLFASITVLALLFSWLFSFFRWLQYFFAALVFGMFIFALFNQFALFDKGSFLADSLGRLFKGDLAAYCAECSHILAAAFAALVFWLFLMRSKRSTLGYFTGILFLSWSGLLSDAYFNPGSRDFRNLFEPFNAQPAKTQEAASDRGKNFILISVPDLASSALLRLWQSENQTIPQLRNAVETALNATLGFYAQNNFIYYPHAFVTDDQPFNNLIRSYNPVDFKAPVSEYTASDVLLPGYWNFSSLAAAKMYLKQNRLYNSFRKKDYAIKVYQSRGLESCYINNRWETDKCIGKQNLPMNLSSSEFTLPQKTMLLTAQWLESTGLVRSFSWINPLLRLVYDQNQAPEMRVPSNRLYVANAQKTFDLLARDVISAGGDNAYFVFVDLPSNLYMYDSFCRIKPMSQWIAPAAGEDTPAVRQAYTEQLACFYAQMENFMQQLSAADKLSSTVIILQGLNAPSFTAPAESEAYRHFANRRLTGFAVYDPLINSYQMEGQACLSPSLLKKYLYKKPCAGLGIIPLLPAQRQEISDRLAADAYPLSSMSEAINAYIKWYGEWAAANGKANSMTALPLPQPEEKVITSQPIADELQELPAESQGVSLKQAIAENPLPAETTETIAPQEKKNAKPAEQPLETPTEVISLPHVELKVKVIDHTQTEVVPGAEVIPPFVSDAAPAAGSESN